MVRLVVFAAAFVAFATASRHYKIDPRVIGGTEVVDIQAVPHHVDILIYPTDTGEAYCNGALISNKHVLTAARCFSRINSPRYIAVLRFGASNVTETRLARIATKVRKHLRYDDKFLENNLAIVEFKPVPLSNQVQPIRLPSLQQGNELFVGARATISGRGLATNNDVYPGKRILRSGETLVITNAVCKTNQPDVQDHILESNICTTEQANQAGFCVGDEGSPLFVTQNGVKILIGVGSFKDLFCETRKPSVFTRVSSYLDWVNAVTSIPIPSE